MFYQSLFKTDWSNWSWNKNDTIVLFILISFGLLFVIIALLKELRDKKRDIERLNDNRIKISELISTMGNEMHKFNLTPKNKFVNERLHKRREELRISIIELSKITGISENEIKEYEKDMIPQERNLDVLSEALKCPKVYLKGYTDKIDLSNEEFEMLEKYMSMTDMLNETVTIKKEDANLLLNTFLKLEKYARWKVTFENINTTIEWTPFEKSSRIYGKTTKNERVIS